MFKGWVEVEPFEYRGSDGSFCVMQRDEVRAFYCSRCARLSMIDGLVQGSPISWRQLWKALIISPAVEPHVLRK